MTAGACGFPIGPGPFAPLSLHPLAFTEGGSERRGPIPSRRAAAWLALCGSRSLFTGHLSDPSRAWSRPNSLASTSLRCTAGPLATSVCTLGRLYDNLLALGGSIRIGYTLDASPHSWFNFLGLCFKHHHPMAMEPVRSRPVSSVFSSHYATRGQL